MSSVIETGRIKKNKGSPLQEDVNYEMMFMDESSLNDMADLQDRVILDLADKEIFRRHSIDYFHFKVENSVIGVYTEDGLIAYNVLYFPGDGEENFGADISISVDELSKVAYLETVAVHPTYRGNSLQRRMEDVHLKLIREMGYEHVCCTVSPKEPSQPQEHIV
jgi:ribosomal protein S18 acetylase RimI-like enzyme